MAFTMEFWVRHVRCLFDVHEMFGDFCIFYAFFATRKRREKFNKSPGGGTKVKMGKLASRL